MFAQAVTQAVRRLRTRELDRCIIGGIDTCVHGTPLADVHALGLLRTEQKPSGFFPGEAAGFVLLERADAARARGARAEALLSASAMAEESFNRFSGGPPQGVALTAVTEACLRETQARPGLVIVNLNGDEFRARDFGTALVRLRGAVLTDDFRQWFPPVSFGETGAATGAAAVCLAVRGFRRDYAGSRAALVLLLGDDEARGAVLVEDLLSSPTQTR
ncbi:beta-ketoacyl synthase N-terminal-like domain-containing protein [Corallococcus sp. bb12-1]|uniref:beta-ketoacyl synthase N-terminal-like domain-containing protein n=1 Tax=Corallococcus sp. bb12-1 TaxID=2996784 RepID=UPI00226F7DAF|nr:beta-ketoacyl synthase N-terminal-like domain-containing protein [Corallococcus sp. bb12-1]MCY1046199.1 beta-ketoacyl synthase N-terminal-like domain-containing protein [Corallococcus sp. bb12-1]